MSDYRLAYVVWILLSALVFLGARGLDDPVTQRDAEAAAAGRQALAALRTLDGGRYLNYDVVSIASVEEEETNAARWIVLCDRSPRTRLDEAIVVEAGKTKGEILRVRDVVR
ncbi:MAG TPA: hypothetical protein VMT00_02825 [Thermoanaerobaculia bacterium]|nr:hypothetical protein [Thermoanaerobaculia bacterium]